MPTLPQQHGRLDGGPDWDIKEEGLDQLVSPSSSSGTTVKGTTTDDADE